MLKSRWCTNVRARSNSLSLSRSLYDAMDEITKFELIGCTHVHICIDGIAFGASLDREREKESETKTSE